MIITCPDCETQFLVDVADIAPDGRDVRCSRCDYQWYVAPVIDKTAVAPPVSAIAPSTAAQDALADEDYQSRLPVPVSQRGPGWRLLVSLILLLLIAAMLGGFYRERARVIEVWPPARTIYERLHLLENQPAPAPQAIALQLRDVRLTGRENALSVSGLISGPSAAALRASLSIRVEDATGNGLYQTVLQGDDLVADPQGARFSVPLPEVPETAHGLLVTLD